MNSSISESIKNAPLSEQVKLDAIRLYEGTQDYLPDLDAAATRDRLNQMSYHDYVVEIAKCHPDVVRLFDTSWMGLFVTGMDAVRASYCREMGYPGFAGLKLDQIFPDQLANEPGGQHGRENQDRANEGDPDMYFPDGNATIARLLVRSLIPGSLPGSSMEDVVTSRVDYSLLDRDEHKIRIRLNSTVINVKNTNGGQVETSYVNDGKAFKVRSGGCVLACWNPVIPYICDGIPDRQKEALSYGVKAPLVYTGVLVANWNSFADAGISRVTSPGGYWPSISLQPSLEMGSYRTARSPDEPIVIRMSCYFASSGLSRRDQHRAGKNKMLATTFDTFEHHIRDQLTRILGPTGFEDERDLLGITVNRWPHGYTYSYNPLFDPQEWAYTTTDDRPCVIGRQPIGRITIANADSAASPHTDAAINEAYRAVSELGDG